MAVNPDFVGRTYPPSGPYAVDAALIAAFAAAVGSADAVHTDAEAARAAGYADVIAPPTMAVRFSQAAERAYIVDPEAGIDYSRVVHGEQRFVHHRPITAGDEVLGTTTVDSVRSAGGHAMVTTRTELSTTTGRCPGHVDVHDRRPRRGGVSMAARPLSEVSVGDVVGPVTVPVGRDTLVGYANASGDQNPIHQDEAFARSVGLPDVIAHGMWTMGASATVVTDWAGDAGRVVEFGTRFTKPVVVPVAGNELVVEGVVKAVDTETGRVTVEVTTTCQGEKVLGRCIAVVRLD